MHKILPVHKAEEIYGQLSNEQSSGTNNYQKCEESSHKILSIPLSLANNLLLPSILQGLTEHLIMFSWFNMIIALGLHRQICVAAFAQKNVFQMLKSDIFQVNNGNMQREQKLKD
jgi:hypothetical protein